MANDHGLIAVMENVDTAGVIVWWRLVGGMDIGRLRTAWANNNLDEEWLPNDPTPTVAMQRAVAEQRGAHRLTRRLKTGTWLVVNEHESIDGDDLVYETDIKVSINEVGRLGIEPDDHEQAETLRARFTHYLSNIIQADVSAWLVEMMPKCSAVGLRDTGGIYFVPRFAVPMWDRMLKALREASPHVISCVPAMRSGEAMDALTEAITQEAKRAADVLERELTDASLGKRALEHRVETMDDIKAKVEAYEDLMGRKLETLHAGIDDLRAQLTTAILKLNPIDMSAAPGLVL